MPADDDTVQLMRVTTRDGVSLGMRRFRARGVRRAVCLCTHAMMANGRYFSSGADHGFAGHLSRRGLDVYVLDWRGHGSSRMPRQRGGWYFEDYVNEDLPAAVGFVCKDAGIAPDQLVYMGHSLGSQVALAALGTGVVPRFRALALWATSVWLPGANGSSERKALMQLFRLCSRPLGYAPARLFGMGSENEPSSYVGQLAHWAETGRWCSRDGVDYMARLWRIDVPTWAATGTGDRLCMPADTDVLLRRLPGADAVRAVGPESGDAVAADHFSLITNPALGPVWDEAITFATDDDSE